MFIYSHSWADFLFLFLYKQQEQVLVINADNYYRLWRVYHQLPRRPARASLKRPSIQFRAPVHLLFLKHLGSTLPHQNHNP